MYLYYETVRLQIYVQRIGFANLFFENVRESDLKDSVGHRKSRRQPLIISELYLPLLPNRLL